MSELQNRLLDDQMRKQMILSGESKAELRGRLTFCDLVIREFAYTARTERSEWQSIVAAIRKMLNAVDLMIAENGELPQLMAQKREGASLLAILGAE